MIEQAIDRSIEDICKRIPDLAIRDLGQVTIAIQNLCIARSTLTAQHSNGIEAARAERAKELAEHIAKENFRNLANL